jgi:outer membrane biosynthesis protein TonB
MGRSFIASLLAHVAVVGLVVLLGRFGQKLPVEETPISVEIVSDAGETKPSPLPPKAPPAQAAPLPQRQAAAPAPPPPAPKVEQKPEPKPAPPPPPPVEAKPEPPTPPPPPKPEPAPEPKKAEAPKPEPVPEPKKAEAPKPEPSPRKPEPPPEPKKAEAPKPEPRKPEPPAEQPKPQSKPEPKKPEPEKPTQVAKAEPKKEKPPEPPSPRTEDSDFDALLRSVEKQAKRVQAPEKREGKGTSAEAGGTNQPGQAQVAQINPSVLAASISRQITPCWNIPVAAQGIGGLRAELNIVMAADGSVQSVVPMDAARMSSDPVFRAFAESAVRAVRACSPLKLPPESYQVWRNIIFNFDPSAMT